MTRLYTVLMLLLVFTACQDNKLDTTQLKANWTLVEGFRNDKPSDMLEGIYFNFSENGTVETNFMGVVEQGTYQLAEAELTLETSKKTKFKVISLDGDELVLKANLMGTSFRFELEKTK